MASARTGHTGRRRNGPKPGVKQRPKSAIVRLGFGSIHYVPVIEHHKPTSNYSIEKSISESMECVGTTFDWAIVTRFDTHGKVESIEHHGKGWERHEPAPWEVEDDEEQEGGDVIE